MADTNFRWRRLRSRLRCFVLAVGRGERLLVGGRAVRGKRRMADKAAEARSRSETTSGKRVAEDPILHAVEIERPSRQHRRVSLPLVRSKQPGTVALDNARIFESIPFP